MGRCGYDSKIVTYKLHVLAIRIRGVTRWPDGFPEYPLWTINYDVRVGLN